MLYTFLALSLSLSFVNFSLLAGCRIVTTLLSFVFFFYYVGSFTLGTYLVVSLELVTSTCNLAKSYVNQYPTS